MPFSAIMHYITGISNGYSGVATMNILANIFLFIPLGFYCEVFWMKRKMKTKIAVLLLIQIIVELIQFSFSLGIFDLEDVILNVLVVSLVSW